MKKKKYKKDNPYNEWEDNFDRKRRKFNRSKSKRNKKTQQSNKYEYTIDAY
jgi:hypothetical protein